MTEAASGRCRPVRTRGFYDRCAFHPVRTGSVGTGNREFRPSRAGRHAPGLFECADGDTSDDVSPGASAPSDDGALVLRTSTERAEGGSRP
ncbi:hypothetical protein SAMN04487904_108127 [Actinopolyspora lacussalsi subsp. righensis]|uniref:Uncharacterized protein n=1 Tax=Actinopolyspora righensis TaxID=995060 RepID=A0A1I7AV85_9ACTN|nr:hypothetical protein SAMN04487904_108127 [Actinopolyspora righensis]